jgi:hypothetical protein
MGRVWPGLGYCVGGVQDFLRCLSGALNPFHPIPCNSSWLGMFTESGGSLQLLLSQVTIDPFLGGSFKSYC